MLCTSGFGFCTRWLGIDDAKSHILIVTHQGSKNLMQADSPGGSSGPEVECDVYDREQKCADAIGTVLVPWAGHFQRLNINIFLK